MNDDATDTSDARSNVRVRELLLELAFDDLADLVTGFDMWSGRPIERLGIMPLVVTDGPNGARGTGLMGTGTPTACIPAGSVLGSTWDPDLVERLGALLGDESRAKGAHVLLAPTINLHRHPLGGRNFECYSEDPYLSGRIAVGFVRGVQSRGVATTPKHFVANDSEFERNTIDVQVDERTLREVYLQPFEDAVHAGGAWGIMSAYNRLNGTYCSEHDWLLQTVLREQWGFDGFVVSDWFAARSTTGSVRAGLSLEMPGEGRFYGRERLRRALDAGEFDEAHVREIATDVLVALDRTGALDGVGGGPETTLDRPADRALIREAAAAGTVLVTNNGLLPLDPATISSIAVIGPNARAARIMGGGSAGVRAYREISPYDALVERFAPDLEIHYAQGCSIDRSTPALGSPILDGPITIEFFAGHDHQGDPLATATAATASFRYFGSPADGVPAKAFSSRATGSFTPDSDGPHLLRLVQSGRTRVLLDGEVAIDATEGDYGRGDDFFGFGSAEIEAVVECEAGRTVALTIEFSNRDAILLSGMRVGLVDTTTRDLVSESVALAATCDVAVVVVGTNDDWETEGRDRESFELPGEQPELIRRVTAANPHTVVVVNTGGPHGMEWLEVPAAVMWVGFGGQELGHALVDVLVGDSDPGGRMSSTIAHRIEHSPALLNYPGENSVVRYGEGLFVGHRWFDARHIAPAVAFGHGMSYASFDWGEPQVTGVSDTKLDEPITVSMEVTNVGSRRGTEVVQLYIEPHCGPMLRPVRELKGFAKVNLDPGATTTVSIELGHRSFASFDPGDPGFAELASAGPVPAEAGARRRSEPGWYVSAGRYVLVLARSAVDHVAQIDVQLVGDDAHRAP